MDRFLTASVCVFRTRGSGVQLHLSFGVLAAILLLRDPTPAGVVAAASDLGIFLACVLTREGGTRPAGWALGARQSAPALVWPFGSLSPDPHPASPAGVIGTSLAGLVSLAALRVFLGISGNVGAHAIATGVLAMNLIPAPPFDAGRMFRAALSQVRGAEWGRRVAASAGFLASAVLCVAGPFTGRMELVGVALFLACWTAWEWRSLDSETSVFGEEESAKPSGARARARWRAWREGRARTREAQIRRRVDRLLEKVGRSGLSGLSWRERRRLRAASREFRRWLSRDERHWNDRD